VGIVSFGIDITDRKLAEDALQKSERSYRLLAENVTDVIWTMDLDLKFTYLSPSIARLIGYSVEEATLLTLEKILTPSSLRIVQTVIAEELENENNPQKDPLRSRTLEVEEYRKDGRIILVEVKTSFLRDQNGRAIGMQGISRDVTERKVAENALIESEAKYRTIFENTGNAALILDEDTTISHANEVADEIFGYRGEDVVGKKSWTEFIHKDYLEFMKKYHYLRRSDPKAVPRSYELRLIDAHGKMRYAFITIAMIPGTKQSVASLTDITERKAAEEKLKTSLQEKEILLKEVHHRVKNNLQVVSSLLSLQSECIKDKQTVEMFRESQNRIKSMALIHEKLYRSKDISKINFSEYIRSLSGNLVRSYETVSGVRLNLNVEDIYLGIDAAIPCGLIINELVSNSLKHAFPAGSKSSEGEIKIEFLRDDNNKFELTVSDNGVGFPRDVDFQQTESLGLQLVRILTDQLSGSIELHRSSGTKFIITFTENKT
jgi:PAS domain S-box-containing protein